MKLQKAGLIKGSGVTCLTDVIVGNFYAYESKLELKTWFSRVPTHSDLSDRPSRMNFDLVITLGVPCTKCHGMKSADSCFHALDKNGAMAGRERTDPTAMCLKRCARLSSFFQAVSFISSEFNSLSFGEHEFLHVTHATFWCYVFCKRFNLWK